jgi:hypothetical protein
MSLRAAALRLAIILVLLAAVGAFGSTSAPRAFACTLVHPKTGDLNGDGRTDSLDALQIMVFTAGLMKPAPSAIWLAGADVDCNGVVNSVDATLILQSDAGLYHIRP